MKKLAFLMLSITALLTSNSALGQHYHEDDKEGLRQFLRQQSSAPTKLNIEVLNTMSLADTLDWYTSETWVDKLTRANYLLWENMPKRLTTIKIESKSISGILDCELFPMIRYIYCKQNGLRGVNLPNNPNLLKLDCSNNKLVTIDLSNCPQLNYLSLHYNQLTDINTTNCLELTDILCRSNYLVKP